MKKLIKSALLGIAMMMCANFVSAQELKPLCYDDVYISFSSNISLVPAYTEITLIVHFKQQYIYLYNGATSKVADTHPGYITDKQTPFTYSKMCMSYNPEHVQSMELRVRYGYNGILYFYYISGYVNSYTIGAPYTGSGNSPY